MPKYFRSPYNGSTTYHVVGDNPTKTVYGEGMRPFGTARVTHAEYLPNFSSRLSSLNNDTYQTHDEEADTLFEHRPAKITSAFSHPDSIHHMPMLLAMAHKEHGSLIPSQSLSPYSSRLAKGAVARGLLQHNEDNPHSDTTNDIGFADTMGQVWSDEEIHDYAKDRVPEQDVKETKLHLRSMLGRDKQQKPHMSTQFNPEEHMERLPGVTW